VENILQIQLKTLTPLWTGDIDRRSNEIQETAIVGSIRWWYESLVRGLGGFACDPTSNDSCIFDEEAYSQTNSLEAGLKDVCPVCRVFGCTGYSSKFRLLITDSQGNAKQTRLSRRGGEQFQLQFVFVRPLRAEELWLWQKTLTLIDKWGSIGGQTTKKPPKMPDFGLVKISSLPELPAGLDRNAVEAYLNQIITQSENIRNRLTQTPKEYPRLDHFFFKSGYWINQQQINDLLKIDPTGFLAGRRGISKKVFSFRERGAARIWGYTTDDAMLTVVLKKLNDLGVRGTKTGKEVLHGL